MSSRSRYGATIVLVSSGLLAGLWTQTSAQGAPPSAFLSVLDAGGNPVTNLDPSQVSMQVDGTECSSVRLEPIAWPMRLTVLVDNGEASIEAFSNIREGLRRFLFEVPDGVETSLVTLAPQPRWIVRPTGERQDFWRGIDLVVPDRGPAKFLEGLAEAAARIDRDKDPAFSAIMIVTTNGGESSGGDLQKAFDRLRSQVQAHPVVVHVLMLAVSEKSGAAASAGEAIAPGTQTTSLQFAQPPAPGTALPGQPGAAVAAVTASRVLLKTSGALQTQVGLALAKDTGGRYEGIAAASNLLTLLPEFGRRIARSYLLQRSQYRVTCEQAGPVRQSLSVYTTYPGSRSVFISRDGRIP